jgi:hypothetical protein
VYPARSTLTLNQSLNFSKNNASISTLNGLSITDYNNTFQPIKVSEVRINNSSITYTDAFNFGSNSYLPIRVSSIFMNGYQVNTSNANLMFNGNQLATTNYISSLGVTSNFKNINTENLNSNSRSSLTVWGPINAQSSITAPSYKLFNNTNYSAVVASDAYGSIVLNNIANSTITTNIVSGFNPTTNTYNVALSNVSSINGFSYVAGGGGVSTLSNWSLYPVIGGQPLSFGSQIAQISGNNYAIFNNQLGQPMRVVGSEFTPLNTSAGVQVKFGIKDSNASILDMANNYSQLNLSSVSVYGNTITADSSNLYVNSSNVVSSWYNYPASNYIIGNKGVVVSNVVDGAKPLQMTNGVAFLGVNQYNDGSTVFSSQPTVSNPIVMETAVLSVRTSPTSAHTDIGATYVATSGVLANSLSLNNNTLTTDAAGNLTYNGTVINTAASLSNWATYPAVGTVEADHGIICSGTSNAVTLINAHNNNANCGFVLDSVGTLNIANDPSNPTFGAAINYIGRNHYVYGPMTFTDFSAPLGVRIDRLSISNVQTLGVNGAVVTGDASNLYVNSSRVVTGSYAPIVLSNRNLTYTSGNLTICYSGITSPTKQSVLMFQVTTPSGFVQGSSNFFTIQYLDNIYPTSNAQNFNILLPTSNSGATQNCSFVVNTVGSNSYINMSASYNGVYQFSNVRIKPLVD